MSDVMYAAPGEVSARTGAVRLQLAGDLGGRVPVIGSLAERGDVGAAAINALGAAVAELQSAVALQLGFALASIDAVVEQVCAADCVER